MGAACYETALVGRMHCVGSDQRHGFERSPVGEYSATYPWVPRQGAELFQTIPSSTSVQTRVAVEIAGRGRTGYQEFDDIITEGALAYLDEKANGGVDARPFAAVVGYVLPTVPSALRMISSTTITTASTCHNNPPRRSNRQPSPNSDIVAACWTRLCLTSGYGWHGRPTSVSASISMLRSGG